VALLYETATMASAGPAGDAPLVVAVGDGVRRGLPTAARATVASRAPLTGQLGDGQVGSDLARRLATLCDALVLGGRVEGPGAVLHMGGAGEPELVRLPELAGRGPAAVHAALCERFGACASLSIGAAGERQLPFASLAAGDDPPHFVGRGGLGAVLGRLGLKAIALTAPPVPASDSDELREALSGSPRLEGRAEGGTLELFGALGARGELRARGESTPVAPDVAAGIEAEASTSRSRRHGCKGCPTPCGWMFDTGRREQGARFGATHALGLNLGLEGFDDALGLLSACDEVGADAKEVGAALALLATARERGLDPGPALFGERAALERILAQAIEGAGDGSRLARGALAFAGEVGLAGELTAVRGAAVRPAHGLAGRLGQCASSRGSDPMRTFPFLTDDAADRDRLRALVAPLVLPPDAQDPARAAGKGRLVWWHENLSVALDATGFCAFSAAALLVDGACSLGQLARWIAPTALLADAKGEEGAARALLAAGEQIVRLQRMLNEVWAGPGAQDLPGWARAELDVPGVWPEYRALRGLDGRGDLTPETRARFGRGDPGPSALPGDGQPEAAPATGPPTTIAPGRVVLRSSGLLARSLGDELELELPLPARVGAVLARASEGADGEARAILTGERAPPVAYRDGHRVGADDWVRDGDRLDLLLVISGGAR
jgi:aldehyde:ferredoxin oxidoreductase